MRLAVSFVMAGALSFLSTGLFFHPDAWSEPVRIAVGSVAMGASIGLSGWYFARGAKPEPTPEHSVKVSRLRYW